MGAAMLSMVSELSPAALKTMEKCWAASHQDEDMLEYAREHVEDCWPNLAKTADCSTGA